MGLGGLLLVASGGYYTYSAIAKSRLSESLYTEDRPSSAWSGPRALRDDGRKGSTNFDVGEAGTSTQSQSNVEVIIQNLGTSVLVESDLQTESVNILTPVTNLTVETSKTPITDVYSSPTSFKSADNSVRVSDQDSNEESKVTTGNEIFEPTVFVMTYGLVSTKATESNIRLNNLRIKMFEIHEPDNSNAKIVNAGAMDSDVIVTDGFVSSVKLNRPTDTPRLNVSPTDSASPPVLSISQPPSTAFEIELAKYSSPDSIELVQDSLAATRIWIPRINVDSGIKELELLTVENRLVWETPKNTVGHIPTTARPASHGEGWYFGHLESPIKGEGNVFLRLPEIPRLVRSSPVYVILEDELRSYLYQVYKTEIMHRDLLKITDSGVRDITLVTCVPRFVYDHRLVVRAALIGVKRF